MQRRTRSRLLWTVWMAGGGVTAGVVAWLVTASWLWTVIVVLASGPVLNTIGQMLMQPVRAARGHGDTTRTT